MELVRVLVSLSLVVGLIYGVSFLFRLYQGRITGSQGADVGGGMKLVQVLPLGPGKALFLVALGEWAFLIASSGSGLTLIAQLESRELREKGRQVLENGMQDESPGPEA